MYLSIWSDRAVPTLYWLWWPGDDGDGDDDHRCCHAISIGIVGQLSPSCNCHHRCHHVIGHHQPYNSNTLIYYHWHDAFIAVEDNLGPKLVIALSCACIFITVTVRMSVLLLPIAQVKEKCGWWEGLVHTRGVSRSTTMTPGGLCAMMTGTYRMPQSPVVNLAMAELWLQLGMLLMEEEVVQFGMMMWTAVAVKPASLSVPIAVLEYISVSTVKMQEWSVQVSHTLMVSPTINGRKHTVYI